MNNSNLSIFVFGSNEVRVLYIDGEIWFVGSDICKILGISNFSDSYKRLKDYEVKTIDSIEGVDNPKQVVISESGLYRLILTSRKPNAEPFQNWVCQSVIPSIRKTGQYSIKSMSPAELIIAQGQAMLLLEQKQAQLEAEQFRLSQVVTLEAQRTDSIEALVHQHDHELDRVFNSSGHYYTVMGYCSLKNRPIAVSEASKLGKKAARVCRQRSIDVVPVADPRFGRVNSYPEYILDTIIN